MKRSESELSSPYQRSKRPRRGTLRPNTLTTLSMLGRLANLDLVEIDEPGSSSVQSPVPQSSQPLAESSQAASLMTEKSLGDHSASEKGRWREYEDEPEKFFEHLDLPPVSKEYMRRRFQFHADNTGDNLKSFLMVAAMTDLTRIQKIVELAGKERSIQWSLLDLSGSLEMTDGSCDDLIFCWLGAMKINRFVTTENTDEYEQLFRYLLPIAVKPVEETSDVVASAFHREERPTSDGRLASEKIYRKIVQYYKAYPNGKYLAPYTSVVGPSGIGKSFIISQMAHGYGMYVVYSNFAEKGMLPYPERSAIADIVPHKETRAVQASFWESYIMVAMCDVELFRRVRVSPGGFYYLQTMKAYRDYQEDFSKRVFAFFENYRGIFMQSDHSNQKRRRSKVAELLLANVEVSEKKLESWREYLEKNNHNPTVTAAAGMNVPNALICLDEARTLLDGEGSVLFRSFRDAIRSRFARTSKTGDLNPTKPQGDFFALLLDTTSKVANFSPPVTSDHSQKRQRGAGRQLFPPLYAIDTINIFTSDGNKSYPDGSEEATIDLFHYGRPLWGARFASGESLFEIMELAKQKLEGWGPLYLTLLLSY